MKVSRYLIFQDLDFHDVHLFSHFHDVRLFSRDFHDAQLFSQRFSDTGNFMTFWYENYGLFSRRSFTTFSHIYEIWNFYVTWKLLLWFSFGVGSYVQWTYMALDVYFKYGSVCLLYVQLCKYIVRTDPYVQKSFIPNTTRTKSVCTGWYIQCTYIVPTFARWAMSTTMEKLLMITAYLYCRQIIIVNY